MLPVLVFMLALSFYLSSKSSSNNWNLLALPDDWVPKLDKDVSFVFTIWMVFQYILYLVPIGNVVKGPEVVSQQNKPLPRLSFRLNGFFVLAINIAAFLAAKLYGLRVSLVAEKSVELWTIAFVFQLILSIQVYFYEKKSGNAESKLNTGVIDDWLIGLSTNPRIGFLDIKYITFRSANIAAVMYQLAVIAKHYEMYQESNPTLLVTVAMYLLYQADGLWFEATLPNLKEIYREGCGALHLLSCIMMPFLSSIAANIIVSTNHQQSWYFLTPVVVIFLIGYWIYRGSNDVKFRYRQNPRAEEFKDYEVLRTSSGKNLLISGWWGKCRHPNYFGDIILNFAICFPAGCTNLLAFLFPTLSTLHLIGRAEEDGLECKRKYGEDWDTYCHRVKYKIVPGIY